MAPREKSPLFSRRAQMFVLPARVDWKTKYLPSGVQLPQHSAGGVFQPESKGRRLVPSPRTSHSELEAVLASATVKRSVLPSGDQRGQAARPGALTSFLLSVPSALHRYNSFAFA